MTDEHLLTAAKLREQAARRLDGDSRLLDHTGQISDPQDRASLSFIETADLDLDGLTEFGSTSLGSVVQSKFVTDEATKAVFDGNSSALSHFVGVTEQDLDASALTLPARLSSELVNDGALTTILAAGDPNTGKTNSVSVLAELAQIIWPDLLILSNVRSWELTDLVVTSAHELAVTLLENRDRPKFVFVDEGSTHFDNRTNSYSVASQFSPLHKRMSKVGVEVCAIVGHTGKDVDPELKRLTNLAFFKTAKDRVDFYERWPPDSDRPADRLFGGSLESLEATSATYDPDDAAPWAWDLEADLFSLDLDWSELMDELNKRGPAKE